MLPPDSYLLWAFCQALPLTPQPITELIPSAPVEKKRMGWALLELLDPRHLPSRARSPVVPFPLLHLGQFQHPSLLSDCLSHFPLLFLLKADLNK